jgi:hypothetical protein
MPMDTDKWVNSVDEIELIAMDRERAKRDAITVGGRLVAEPEGEDGNAGVAQTGEDDVDGDAEEKDEQAGLADESGVVQPIDSHLINIMPDRQTQQEPVDHVILDIPLHDNTHLHPKRRPSGISTNLALNQQVLLLDDGKDALVEADNSQSGSRVTSIVTEDFDPELVEVVTSANHNGTEQASLILYTTPSTPSASKSQPNSAYISGNAAGNMFALPTEPSTTTEVISILQHQQNQQQHAVPNLLGPINPEMIVPSSSSVASSLSINIPAEHPVENLENSIISLGATSLTQQPPSDSSNPNLANNIYSSYTATLSPSGTGSGGPLTNTTKKVGGVLYDFATSIVNATTAAITGASSSSSGSNPGLNIVTGGSPTQSPFGLLKGSNGSMNDMSNMSAQQQPLTRISTPQRPSFSGALAISKRKGSLTGKQPQFRLSGSENMFATFSSLPGRLTSSFSRQATLNNMGGGLVLNSNNSNTSEDVETPICTEPGEKDRFGGVGGGAYLPPGRTSETAASFTSSTGGNSSLYNWKHHQTQYISGKQLMRLKTASGSDLVVRDSGSVAGGSMTGSSGGGGGGSYVLEKLLDSRIMVVGRMVSSYLIWHIFGKVAVIDNQCALFV